MMHDALGLEHEPRTYQQGPDLRYLRCAIWREGHFLAWAHFVESIISRCFFANQNSLAEDEETIQIFSSKLF